VVIPFFIYSASTGAPLAGVSPTFAYYKRRNSGGSITALSDPTITDKGAGNYEFTIVDADLVAGSTINYVIDCTTSAAGRYQDGHVDAADVVGRVSFFLYSASTGALVAGLSPTLGGAGGGYYQRRNADGSFTNLADPTITDRAGGLYDFSAVTADLIVDTIVHYIVDCGAGSASAFLDGHIETADVAAPVVPPVSAGNWLKLNGVDLGPIAAVASEPKGERREIGDVSPALDGTMRVTRQTRKRDMSIETIPLTGSDAFAWESLVTGEGERWSFDASLYGSKGLGPVSGSGYSLVAGSAKFGSGKLRLAASTGMITYGNAALHSSGETLGSTIMVWRLESGTWHHYIVRSDGAKWFDGARNDALVTDWLVVAGANIALVNTAGAAQDYDDLVALPFKILDQWAEIFGTATTAFSSLPYLDATGLLVPEISVRRVTGTATEKVLVATAAGAVQHDMRKLSIELQGT